MTKKQISSINGKIKKLVKNWDNISDDYKSLLIPDRYSKPIEGLSVEEHYVVLLLNRQKPSVEACYDFDEERIGVNRKGKVVWGFDSGCSCPSPWQDSYPDCYQVSKNWNEFEVHISTFDDGVLAEVERVIDLILKTI